MTTSIIRNSDSEYYCLKNAKILFIWGLFFEYTVHHPICGPPICGQNPICARGGSRFKNLHYVRYCRFSKLSVIFHKVHDMC